MMGNEVQSMNFEKFKSGYIGYSMSNSSNKVGFISHGCPKASVKSELLPAQR
jgi:hypothetical protein